jgi:hypothetical protein
MARLLADDAFPQPATIALRRLGHDIVGLEETGRLSRWSRDDEILEVARDSRRALLTLDHRSFTHQVFHHTSHSGIIICTFDPNFIGLAHRIHALLSGHAHLDGHVIRVGRQRTVFA